MSYLKEFLHHIARHDYPPFLRLWEEYCCNDEADTEEILQILRAAKKSEFSDFFGKHIDKILPLWETIEDNNAKHEIFKLIIDIETINTPKLREIVYNYLHDRYSSDKHFQEKMKLIGMRSKDGKEAFQGAVSNYELLSHIAKGKFVFHSGGWGVGQILDYSLVREELSIEFENVSGKKEVPFTMAFKTLQPIADEHFLAKRFADPDALEHEAKKDPVSAIKMLLKDLGPKTASEIKEEMEELVIPAADWAKWWQVARAKLKKDTMVETPSELKQPFILRAVELTHEEKLKKALQSHTDTPAFTHLLYSFIKDFPDRLKNQEFKSFLRSKVEEQSSFAEISKIQRLQLYFLLKDLGGEDQGDLLSSFVMSITNAASALDMLSAIPILAYKKRLLVAICEMHSSWKELFLELLLPLDQNSLRDYVLSELIAAKEEAGVTKKLMHLCMHPGQHPDTFLWYYQKVMSQKKLPMSDKAGRLSFFEALFILLSQIESSAKHKEDVKKIHAILSEDRYAVVRKIMQEASIAEVQEYLLLSTKCHTLSDHDIKILHSLAEVAHPSLAKLKKSKKSDEETMQVLWTTQQGFLKLQARIQQIATVETIENAKEIEVARAHGDLRENAEFKAALERRDRLQSELKFLSDQMNLTRIITKEDINTDEVGPGCVVECIDAKGNKSCYTLLGPWDADPDKNILALQSKLAQAMQGCGVGDKFVFQVEEYTVASIKSYL